MCGTVQAGTPRLNDVVLTSMRRDDVASMSVRRHFDVECLLGSVYLNSLYTCYLFISLDMLTALQEKMYRT